MKTIVLFILLLLVSPGAYTQATAPSPVSANNSSELEALSFDKVFDKITLEETDSLISAVDPTSSIKFVRVKNEFYYVVILSLMCLLCLSIVLFFLVKLKKDAQPKDIVSGAGLIIIVFGTIILVLIVDTSEQLTAAIGILGAIAGYLFRSAQENGHKPDQKLSAEKEN
ncbi:MAG: hypothetical protein H6937_04830 [Burkholderiales bacterium]|nr:hypothetical protein [Burkholderiales bacterium]MDR4518102.1 hypothetical protein [Nitrosomonas sp.]